MSKEIATFGAGCFWGVEETFRNTEGVVSTRVGYMGGDKKEPTYEQVCHDDTGHAEVVEVTFDTDKISYRDLVRKFFELHDPTQLNKQGPDIGDQYRSVIFFHNNVQQEIAREYKQELESSGKYKDEIVTSIVPAKTFWEAEEYHQKYLLKKNAKTCG